MENYLLNRITMDAEVCNGRPVIRRMRFTVAQMLELVASGMTFDDILGEYPYIERDDISACLLYASFFANHDSKEDIMANLAQGFKEMRMIEEGKLKGRPDEDFLNELCE